MHRDWFTIYDKYLGIQFILHIFIQRNRVPCRRAEALAVSPMETNLPCSWYFLRVLRIRFGATGLIPIHKNKSHLH